MAKAGTEATLRSNWDWVRAAERKDERCSTLDCGEHQDALLERKSKQGKLNGEEKRNGDYNVAGFTNVMTRLYIDKLQCFTKLYRVYNNYSTPTCGKIEKLWFLVLRCTLLVSTLSLN